MSEAPVDKFVGFGIDLGSQKSVIAKDNGEIVLNELGGRTTANLISFKGQERLIGEAAVLASSTNPQNTIGSINLFLGLTLNEFNDLKLKYHLNGPYFTQNERSDLCAEVEYNGSKCTFTMEQLCAMLLVKIETCSKKYLSEKEKPFFVLAIPSGWGARHRQALRHAGLIAGMNAMKLVTQEEALAHCYQKKHPISTSPDSIENDASLKQIIMIFDMGYTSTSVAVVKFTDMGKEILASSFDGRLGAKNFDQNLWHHFANKFKTTRKLEILPGTKKSQRLLNACEKLKEMLSTVPECKIQVENLGEECDLSIEISRDAFEAICEKEAKALSSMLQKVLSESGLSSQDIKSVEVVGGGSRIPLVKNILASSVCDRIGHMLDSASAVAVGAGSLASQFIASSSENKQSTEVNEDKQKIEDDQQFPLPCNDVIAVEIERELEMRSLDEKIIAVSEKKNAIEAFIYDMRFQIDGKFGKHIDPKLLNPILEQAEHWLYSEEADTATLEEASLKEQEIRKSITEACQSFFQAKEAEQKELEQTLEEESKKAELEREANGEDEDHDFRKLKKPERMKLVLKNKEEGTELLKHGNYAHAAARYVKACNHCSKFFDLSESDQEEVRQVKLSLYLNLAQCFIKLENWPKVVVYCKDILDLDPKNVKALYRRSLALEKQKKFEDAEKDIKEAISLSPDDKAIKGLNERIKIQIKRQLDREKKMWSKAFT